MLSKVAEFTKKTKALAENALEALDARDSDLEDNVAKLDPDFAFTAGTVSKTPERRASVATAFSHPQSSSEDQNALLAQLVQALTGSAAINLSDLGETAQVLITHIGLLREQAATSSRLKGSVKDSIVCGSLVSALMHVLEGKGDETVSSLLEALESEQLEHEKTRQRLTSELRRLQQINHDDSVLKEVALLKEERDSLTSQLSEANSRNEELSLESQKYHRMLTKVIKEKAELELERDNEDKIDARVVRSAFVQLVSQLDNKKLRNNLINVMAEILQLSEADRLRTGIKSLACSPVSAAAAAPTGLASEFLMFLQEEIKDPELEI